MAGIPTIHYLLMAARPGEPLKTSPEHPESFTNVPVVLDPRLKADAAAGEVSDKLYSGFVEHVGRCIYGGLVDNPKAPSPADLLEKQDADGKSGRLGWRKDVRKILSKDGDLEIPLMRWPGGNFVSNYHWQDGVGPIESRPKRIELAWGVAESNLFGTDEFIDMCRANKWEPFICLNMGSGTFEEALAWLEYCNGTGDTEWANRRRKNTGRHEPHDVKYWALGNEMWGPWQVGNLSAEEYAEKARQWAHALKLVDPSIKLVSCGETGWGDWDRVVLQKLVSYVDLHSIHFYSMMGHRMTTAPGNEYEKNVFGPQAAERGIQICKSLIDLANVDNTYRRIAPRDVKICFDEWNVWDESKAPGSGGLEQIYDYTDMLAFVAWLNVLVRNHKDVGIACLAQSVNVIAPVMTSPTGILKQTTYWPLEMFSKYMKNGHLLATPSMPDAYDGPTYPSFIQSMHSAPRYVDMVSVCVEDGNGGVSIRLSILNRHPSADWTAPITFSGCEISKATVTEVYSDDLDAANTFEKPDVVTPTKKTYSADEWVGREHTVRKHSWQFIVFEGQKK